VVPPHLSLKLCALGGPPFFDRRRLVGPFFLGGFPPGPSDRPVERWSFNPGALYTPQLFGGLL